jgi:oligopeptidase A
VSKACAGSSQHVLECSPAPDTAAAPVALKEEQHMENPLLAAPLAGSPLPAFDRIRPDHAEPAVALVLAENRAAMGALLARAEGMEGADALWKGIVEPLDDLGERLGRVWGPVVHLFAVTSTGEWRAAYNACLPKVTQYQVELSQSAPLLEIYQRIEASAGFSDFSQSRRQVVRHALRDFTLSGTALPEGPRARFAEIVLRLSQLQSKFQENVIDSVQAWSKHVVEEGQLQGMTHQGKAAARAKAAAKNLEGFRLTLDFPSYDAVLRYADDRRLREELYEAYATRASDRGPLAGRFDNGPLMEEILALRHEQARLLGFRNYAELSLEAKMAESPDAVESFLLELNRKVRPTAKAELDELAEFARAEGDRTELAPWDLPYYSERLKQRRLGFSQDELRPYFPLPQVLGGLFGVALDLYGVRIEEDPSVSAWHRDVTAYRLHDAGGAYVGMFYLDPYAREDKRGGAWMDECIGRRRSSRDAQDPAAYLTCNFAPPLPGEAAQLTHEEVVTLFHEFGHGLHHLLTRVDEPGVSGIRGVEWDAVELPSQFMENWCYDEATLSRFARHVRTGAPLPSTLLQKIKAARKFQAGLAAARQIEFALFDLRLHRDYGPLTAVGYVLSVLGDVRREVSLLVPPEYNRMPSSFAHIFGGGYAAGYYSYKWAEVLSADAFAAFEESGFAPETGRRFRDAILAQGGSRAAMDLFVAFRGRTPSIDALLRQSGFVQPAP